MSTLLTLVETLIVSPAAKAAFAAAPDSYLADHGFGGLNATDVHDALAHAADTFPPIVAAQISGADGLEGAADLDLHELGLAGLDDWSTTDAGGLGIEPVGDTGAVDSAAMLRADIDLDRPPTQIGATQSAPVDATIQPPSAADSRVPEADDGTVGRHHDSFTTNSESDTTQTDEASDESRLDIDFDAPNAEPAAEPASWTPDATDSFDRIDDSVTDTFDDQPDDFEIG